MDAKDDLLKFEQFLRRRSPDRRTPKDYLSDVRQFLGVCSKPWREVSIHDIDTFIDHERQRGLKPATIKRRAAALKTFFDFLAEETGDLNWPNPVRMKRHAGKQPKPLPRDLHDDQVERLWQGITSPRDRAWFVLLLRAGLRAGEVVGLKLTDLLAPAQGEQPARLRVCGKGRKERVVLLSADAYAVLQAWLAVRPPVGHDYLFPNQRDGGPLTVSGLEYCLSLYRQPVEQTTTPHQLRHTFARQATEAGLPLPSLSKLLGHAQISTTQVYTAGADPELCQAYQQAMAQLAQRPLPVLPAPASSPPAAPPAPAQPPASLPPLPEWERWAPELPSGLRQACLEFVQRHLSAARPRLRRQHALKVLGELRRFLEWQLETRPIQRWEELGYRDLQAYQTARQATGKAVMTINCTLARVLSLLQELADRGAAVEPSVFRLKPLPRPDSLPRHLSESEAHRLEAQVQAGLDQEEPEARLENACFFVLAHTGLRASELIDLGPQEVDLPGGRLWVRAGKGGRDRVVYLSETARVALQRYLAGGSGPATAPLFTHPDGRPLSYGWLYQHLLQLGEAAEVAHVTPHRLRHTLATRLLNAGMEITRIQKLLGHEHLDTTMIYARVYEATVEADYRQAMRIIEQQQMPLSNTSLPADGWPSGRKVIVNVQDTLDNSV
jgi:site-specific recombinase XerD